MIKKIAPDKWKHFFAGIFMGVVLQSVAAWLLPTHVAAGTVTSFLIVLSVSYGFELFSKFTGKGHYDVMDAVASIIGGVLGMGLVLLFELRNIHSIPSLRIHSILLRCL